MVDSTAYLSESTAWRELVANKLERLHSLALRTLCLTSRAARLEVARSPTVLREALSGDRSTDTSQVFPGGCGAAGAELLGRPLVLPEIRSRNLLKSADDTHLPMVARPFP